MAELKLPENKGKMRKVNAVYTIEPKIKDGMKKLAKKEGYKSTSKFVNVLFEKLLRDNNIID